MLHVKNLKISPELLSLISKIDTFKGGWAALEQHTTALQLLGDVAQMGGNVRDLLGPLQNKKIDTQMLLALHNAFIVKTNPSIKPGFRSQNFPLVIQQGDKIIGSLDTAAPEDIEVLIPKLLDWLEDNLSHKTHHPVILLGVFSVVFLQIGPFEKGNQKLLRLLLLLLLMKTGYVYAPYVPLDEVMNEKAYSYFDVLKSTQESVEAGKPNWEGWLVFFTGLLRDQKDKLQRQIDSESKDLSNLPTLSAQIMHLFAANERLQMKEIMRLTKGRRSTIKLRLNELVDGGYLKRHGQARATWYSQT